MPYLVPHQSVALLLLRARLRLLDKFHSIGLFTLEDIGANNLKFENVFVGGTGGEVAVDFLEAFLSGDSG